MKRKKKGPSMVSAPMDLYYTPSIHIEGKGKAPKIHVGDRHAVTVSGKVKSINQHEGGHSVTLESHKVKHHGLRTIKKVDNT